MLNYIKTIYRGCDSEIKSNILLTSKLMMHTFIFLFCLVLMICAVNCDVYAAGDGTGGGGGAAIPLYMDWSYPWDGQTGVSVNPVIQCKFSHNVTQETVSGRNLQLISLTAADGTPVAFRAFTADPQLEFDKRQNIYISPKSQFEYGTEYVLTLKEGIQAKNSMATDEDTVIRFTTESPRASFNAPAVTPPVSTALTAGEDMGESIVSDIGAENMTEESGADGTIAETRSKALESKSDDVTDITKEAADTDVDEETIHKSSSSASLTDTAVSAGTAESRQNAETLQTMENSDNISLSADMLLLIALIAAVLFGAFLSVININRKNVYIKRLAALFAGVSLLMFSFSDAQSVFSSTADSLTIKVIIGEEEVLKKSYTYEELKELIDLRQVYSSMGSEGIPCLTAAEGISLESLFAQCGLSTSEVTNIKLYARNGWSRGMTNDYLLSSERYYYPHLSAAWKGLHGTEDDIASGSGLNGEAIDENNETGTGSDAKESVKIPDTQTEDITDEASGDLKKEIIMPGDEKDDNDFIQDEKMQNDRPDVTKAQDVYSFESSNETTEAAVNKQPDSGTLYYVSDEQTHNDAPSLTTDSALIESEAHMQTDALPQKTDYRVLMKSGAQAVIPMLAVRSYESTLAEKADWSLLSGIDGFRLCFGQLTVSDAPSLMYGYGLNTLELTVSRTSRLAEELGKGGDDSLKSRIPGGADSPGSADVSGPYTDPLTGEAKETLPQGVCVQVGYFGTEYYTIKQLSFEEIASLPIVRQAYSIVSKEGTAGTETTLGIRLVDLLTYVGVSVDAIDTLHFSQDGGVGKCVSIAKKVLIDTPRYYYPNLAATWNTAAGIPGTGAAKNAVRVDSILTIKDYWDQDSTVPDFYRVNGTNRFRLVYGQIGTKSDNTGSSLLWIDTIQVQLSGAPSDENWLDEYLGKSLGSQNGYPMPSKPDSANSAGAKPLKETLKDEVKVESELITSSKGHVYEIYDPSASWNFMDEKKDYSKDIMGVMGLMLSIGALASLLHCKMNVR